MPLMTKALAAAAAMSLAATPNPAASLSVAKSVRADAKSANGSDLFAGGNGVLIAVIAAVAVIVSIVIVATDDNSTSP